VGRSAATPTGAATAGHCQASQTISAVHPISMALKNT
jgi:hypothetical protein